MAPSYADFKREIKRIIESNLKTSESQQTTRKSEQQQKQNTNSTDLKNIKNTNLADIENTESRITKSIEKINEKQVVDSKEVFSEINITKNLYNDSLPDNDRNLVQYNIKEEGNTNSENVNTGQHHKEHVDRKDVVPAPLDNLKTTTLSSPLISVTLPVVSPSSSSLTPTATVYLEDNEVPPVAVVNIYDEKKEDEEEKKVSETNDDTQDSTIFSEVSDSFLKREENNVDTSSNDDIPTIFSNDKHNHKQNTGDDSYQTQKDDYEKERINHNDDENNLYNENKMRNQRHNSFSFLNNNSGAQIYGYHSPHIGYQNKGGIYHHHYHSRKKMSNKGNNRGMPMSISGHLHNQNNPLFPPFVLHPHHPYNHSHMRNMNNNDMSVPLSTEEREDSDQFMYNRIQTENGSNVNDTDIGPRNYHMNAHNHGPLVHHHQQQQQQQQHIHEMHIRQQQGNMDNFKQQHQPMGMNINGNLHMNQTIHYGRQSNVFNKLNNNQNNYHNESQNFNMNNSSHTQEYMNMNMNINIPPHHFPPVFNLPHFPYPNGPMNDLNTDNPLACTPISGSILPSPLPLPPNPGINYNTIMPIGHHPQHHNTQANQHESYQSSTYHNSKFSSTQNDNDDDNPPIDSENSENLDKVNQEIGSKPQNNNISNGNENNLSMSKGSSTYCDRNTTSSVENKKIENQDDTPKDQNQEKKKKLNDLSKEQSKEVEKEEDEEGSDAFERNKDGQSNDDLNETHFIDSNEDNENSSDSNDVEETDASIQCTTSTSKNKGNLNHECQNEFEGGKDTYDHTYNDHHILHNEYNNGHYPINSNNVNMMSPREIAHEGYNVVQNGNYIFGTDYASNLNIPLNSEENSNRNRLASSPHGITSDNHNNMLTNQSGSPMGLAMNLPINPLNANILPNQPILQSPIGPYDAMQSPNMNIPTQNLAPPHPNFPPLMHHPSALWSGHMPIQSQHQIPGRNRKYRHNHNSWDPLKGRSMMSDRTIPHSSLNSNLAHPSTMNNPQPQMNPMGLDGYLNTDFPPYSNPHVNQHQPMPFEYSHLIPSNEHGPHHTEYYESAMQNRYSLRPMMTGSYHKGNTNKKGRRRSIMKANNMFYGNNMSQMNSIQDSNDYHHPKYYKSNYNDYTDCIQDEEVDVSSKMSNGADFPSGMDNETSNRFDSTCNIRIEGNVHIENEENTSKENPGVDEEREPNNSEKKDMITTLPNMVQSRTEKRKSVGVQSNDDKEDNRVENCLKNNSLQEDLQHTCKEDMRNFFTSKSSRKEREENVSATETGNENNNMQSNKISESGKGGREIDEKDFLGYGYWFENMTDTTSNTPGPEHNTNDASLSNALAQGMANNKWVTIFTVHDPEETKELTSEEFFHALDWTECKSLHREESKTTEARNEKEKESRPFITDSTRDLPLENAKNSALLQSSQSVEEPRRKEIQTDKNKSNLSTIGTQSFLIDNTNTNGNSEKLLNAKKHVSDAHNSLEEKKNNVPKKDGKKETLGVSTDPIRKRNVISGRNGLVKTEINNFTVDNSDQKERGLSLIKQTRLENTKKNKSQTPVRRDDTSRFQKDHMNMNVNNKVVEKGCISPQQRRRERQNSSNETKRWDPIPSLTRHAPMEAKTNEKEESEKTGKFSYRNDLCVAHNSKHSIILASVGPVSSFDEYPSSASTTNVFSNAKNKQRVDKNTENKKDVKRKNKSSGDIENVSSNQSKPISHSKNRVSDKKESLPKQSQSKQWVQLSSQ